MSNYGLRLRDAGGNIILDYTHKLSRFRYSNEVSAGASGNTTLSDISGFSSVEFGIPLVIDSRQAAHDLSRSGTTLTWTPRSGTYMDSANSLIFLFLYT